MPTPNDHRNIISRDLLATPEEVRREHPASPQVLKVVKESRHAIRQILSRQDPRLFVVVGPCSIHDPKAALEYAERLAELQLKVKERLHLVMRAYFEKPRTTVGWKGFINDPDLDGSFRIGDGLRRGRQLLIQIAEMGLGVGTEALDPITPQYISDLIAWSAIGARTTESQTHREMASGLSSPVGIKNGTDGNVEVAVNALKAVAHPQSFLGVTLSGQCAIFRTRGNATAHLILRGGARPNYDSVSVSMAQESLRKAGVPENIVIDCSHGNSLKQAALQPLVLNNGINQVREGNHSIVGFMLESHLNAGRQAMAEPAALAYGVSITDECISWSQTEDLLLEAHARLEGTIEARSAAAAEASAP